MVDREFVDIGSERKAELTKEGERGRDREGQRERTHTRRDTTHQITTRHAQHTMHKHNVQTHTAHGRAVGRSVT